MIIFTKEQISQIEYHAKRESPNEACGILAGKIETDKTVKKVYTCKNVDSSPRVGYLVDPRDQLRVFEDIDKNEYELIGFYHSHPMGLDTPSMIDVGRAKWPEYSYVIISLSKKIKIGSWIWREETGRFEEEKIKTL